MILNMGEVINLDDFEFVWHVTCPECGSDTWFIVIDRPQRGNEEAIQIQCAECGYTLPRHS